MLGCGIQDARCRMRDRTEKRAWKGQVEASGSYVAQASRLWSEALETRLSEALISLPEEVGSAEDGFSISSAAPKQTTGETPVPRRKRQIRSCIPACQRRTNFILFCPAFFSLSPLRIHSLKFVSFDVPLPRMLCLLIHIRTIFSSSQFLVKVGEVRW